ncbi:MAG: histidinol-phosphatase [Treponema sp.]|nr:histidinol-phosphatase [Treponema sp.]
MIKTNYHTHTDFCDGNGTVNQIAQNAIQKGFNILGFSSHSMYPFSGSYHIVQKEHPLYVQAVNEAKEKYKNQLTILLGFEAEYAPNVTKPDFSYYKSLSPDYLIGSVHYIFTPKGRLAVDYNAERLEQKINELFGGNAKKMVCEYFALEREMLSNSAFSIIGHPDLVRKNNGRLHMFCENDSWYRKEIKATANAIKKAGVIVEVNTGAIARKYMDDVYPSKEFLSLLSERNIPVTINSDSHTPEGLDAFFDKAKEALWKAGYNEVAYIDENKNIRMQKLE